MAEIRHLSRTGRAERSPWRCNRIHGSASDAHGTGLAETWRGALRFNGATAADLDRVFEAYRSAVAVVPETRIVAYLEDAGFGGVTRIFQAGMMHGWRARR